jgi:hypothetical protein
MGMAFNRQLWNKFVQCSSHFCQVNFSFVNNVNVKEIKTTFFLFLSGAAP